MNRTIWKYELSRRERQTIAMPAFANILSVQTQRNNPCMWVEVDPDACLESRFFEIYPTGGEIHYDMGVSREHLGTFQIFDSNLVFHVYENTGA